VSVNRNRQHVFVLPEDDANRQLAVGFFLGVEWMRQRQMQVLPVAGGWRHVLDVFRSDHVAEMERYTTRHMVLLIDFDNDGKRLKAAKGAIPDGLADRVFVLGALTEPEDLKAALGAYEDIGRSMARDCREETDRTWGHHLLQHNRSELERLRTRVRPFLFEPA
jgi:hypothetical protein